MEVVKLAYLPIVLYCLLASYSEAQPYRYRCGKSVFYNPSQESHRVKRIVQGNAADYGEWPWQISLIKRGTTKTSRPLSDLGRRTGLQK